MAEILSEELHAVGDLEYERRSEDDLGFDKAEKSILEDDIGTQQGVLSSGPLELRSQNGQLFFGQVLVKR